MHTAPPNVGHVSTPGSILGRLAFFVVLGFLVIIMIGPVVAVLSAVLSVILSVAAVIFGIGVGLLPFAIVGVAVWGLYQTFAPGNEGRATAFKRRVGEFAQTFGRFTTTLCSHTYRAMRWSCVKGWTCLGYAGRAANRSYLTVRNALSGQGRRWGRFAFEVGCAMALATGVCLAVSDAAPEAIPIGLLAGALIGGAVSWPRPEPRVQPPQPVD